MMVDNQFIFIGFDKKSIYLYNIKIVVKYTYNIFVFIEERMDLGGQIMGICNYQDQKIAQIDTQINQLSKQNTPQAQNQIKTLYQQRNMQQAKK